MRNVRMASTASVTKTRNLIAQKTESNLCCQQDDFGSVNTWLPNFKIHYVIFITYRVSRFADWATKLNSENGVPVTIFSDLC
jgi:hypothetical protein